MLRHTAFFLARDTTTPAERVLMQKGLAYMRFECPTVRALDYGADIFGGSGHLKETKSWKRTPLWRAKTEGPAFNYDVALHLDFDDQAGLDAYNVDDTHHEVGDYDAAVSFGEFTARVDYWYDGPPLIDRGLVRHSSMFLWADDVTDTAKNRATDAFRQLASAPGVKRVNIGENVGTTTTDYDWILDVHVSDPEATATLLKSDAYAEAVAAVIPATKYEWTARLSHVMRGL
jgi:Stress responsive A/B Barrel Domain